MRRSVYMHLLVFSGFALLPFVAHAATNGFFGPIISPECTCANGTYTGSDGTTVSSSAPAWGCILQTFQNILNALVSLSMVAITIFLAYSGFTMIASPTNEENRLKARTGLLNAVLGLLIVLCAWLLVDGVMKALYNPNAGFGPWNQILGNYTGPDCLMPRSPGQLPGLTDPNNAAGGNAQSGTGLGAVIPTGGAGKGGTAQCNPNNPACSVSALQSMGLSQSQAQAMSCIAMSESSGNPNTPNSNTGACGTFQITTQPGNWHNPAFHSGSCSVNSSCNDYQCNMQTAVLMFDKVGYQPWTGTNPKTGQPWNPTARTCVSNFDPSHA